MEIILAVGGQLLKLAPEIAKRWKSFTGWLKQEALYDEDTAKLTELIDRNQAIIDKAIANR